MSKLYKNVPVLAKGGRDATATFLQRNQGDVLITFESEVVSIDREFGAGKVDAIYPSVSIVAENPVAVVERTVAKGHGAAGKGLPGLPVLGRSRKLPPNTPFAPLRSGAQETRRYLQSR